MTPFPSYWTLYCSVHPETRFFVQVQGKRRLEPQEYSIVFRGLQSEYDTEIEQKGRF